MFRSKSKIEASLSELMVEIVNLVVVAHKEDKPKAEPCKLADEMRTAMLQQEIFMDMQKRIDYLQKSNDRLISIVKAMIGQDRIPDETSNT